MTVDESAAFDVVSHDILIKKMILYKFTPSTIKWFLSYLSGRAQYVSIDTKSSRMSLVKSGVPQGSVLGPLMYTLYINELPEVVKSGNNCNNIEHYQHEELFGKNCYKCGEIICYADDASVVYSSNSRQQNQQKLVEHLENVNNFLTDNKLIINREKTTITEVMIRQKRAKLQGEPPSMMVLDKHNNPKHLTAGKYTRLLGGTLVMTWGGLTTWNQGRNNPPQTEETTWGSEPGGKSTSPV